MQLLIWLVLKDLADDASPLDRSDEWSQTDDDKMAAILALSALCPTGCPTLKWACLAMSLESVLLQLRITG